MKKIRKALAILCLVAGGVLSIYVGGYLMLFRPIQTLISTFNEGTMTLHLLIVAIVKIALSATFAGFVWCVGYVGYNHFIGTEDPDWEAIERERGFKKDEDEE